MRFLRGSCPVPARRPGGSCLAAERFLPRGQTVPARPDGSCQAVPARPKRFLRGSCPVPARFLRPPKRFLPNGVSKSRIVSFLYHIISSLQTRRTTRREQVARLFQDRGAGLSPCARNTIREAISRDTSSSQHAGHAVRRNRTRNAAGTFSGHCQRSRRICEQKCGWPSLSDDEELVEEPVTARRWTSSSIAASALAACAA